MRVEFACDALPIERSDAIGDVVRFDLSGVAVRLMTILRYGGYGGGRPCRNHPISELIAADVFPAIRPNTVAVSKPLPER